jgi:hypothetical protein
MLKDIQVKTLEDGGNPRMERDIVKKEEGFYIHPFSEDDDGNYRFRLNVELINVSDNPIPVKFDINWGDTEYQDDRKYVLLSKDDDLWEKLDMEIYGIITSGIVNVPPGHSYLSMHPRYEHGRFLKLLGDLPKDRFNIIVIGQSRHGRDIFAIEAGRKDSRPLAVMTRVHPYESIGSYFAEGMIHWLKYGGEDTDKFLNKHRVIFVPMPNPDGVSEGTCKRTLGGLNFSEKGSISSEPEAVVVREYFTGKNPKAIFDLHGWMIENDNIVTNDAERGRALHTVLTQNSQLFSKPIEILFKKYPTGGKNNLGGLLADEVGAVFYNSSWSWFGRTAKDLYNMGVCILKNYAALF